MTKNKLPDKKELPEWLSELPEWLKQQYDARQAEIPSALRSQIKEYLEKQDTLACCHHCIHNRDIRGCLYGRCFCRYDRYTAETGDR